MRLKPITRRAVWRLAALFAGIGLALVWAWFAMIRMPGRSHEGPLPPLTAEQAALSTALQQDVQALAGVIGERHLFRPRGLDAAILFIDTSLRDTGHAVRRQEFVAQGQTCVNLEIEVPGSAPAEGIIVIGAHYDSVAGCPAANDNASGVAAVLALARVFHGGAAPLRRTLRFVLFANEEPPFFQSEEMGSLVYARECRRRGENIVAMMSLETIGYYSDQPGSQQYPALLGVCYPSTGNFIAFVGNYGSRRLVRQVVGSFREHAAFPSEGAALPAFLPGISWSDHWSFWSAGYPAVMVSDTAPFRYPHYHAPSDTPDKLDYERMARVVEGLEKVIRDVAN